MKHELEKEMHYFIKKNMKKLKNGYKFKNL